jgi:RNA polymerase sigma-70 factor (ECF subfamily)
VSERLSEGDPSLPLANVDAPGLYLACACALGVRGAVELADAICSTHVISALRRLGIESTLRDEVLARLRTMLFAGSAEGGPLLLAFKGRGTLRSWVHSVAVHQALKLRRSDRPLVSIEQLATDLVDSRSDPEMAYLKIFYLEEFRAALHRAMTAIPKDARNLLRQHYLDRMSLEAVAQVHRVHRATAARWLSEARRHVLDKTKEELTLALELHPSEVDSILSFVRRQSSFGDHLSGVGLALSDT